LTLCRTRESVENFSAGLVLETASGGNEASCGEWRESKDWSGACGRRWKCGDRKRELRRDWSACSTWNISGTDSNFSYGFEVERPLFHVEHSRLWLRIPSRWLIRSVHRGAQQLIVPRGTMGFAFFDALSQPLRPGLFHVEQYPVKCDKCRLKCDIYGLSGNFRCFPSKSRRLEPGGRGWDCHSKFPD
jgi:hypothetical protein